jgi:hypothetical protein
MAKKKTNTSKQNDKIVAIPVPIKYYTPDQIISRFANHMVIQLVENEFKISFFETKPEIRFGTTSESVPKEIVAECVGAIIVTPDRVPKFIEAMQKQLEKYNLIRKADNQS